MPTASTEEIPLGPLHIRFLIDGTAEPAAHRSLSLFEFSVAPGARVPIAHSHDAYDETLYGLDGTLTMTLWSSSGEPARTALGPGDVLFIPRGAVHRFDNFSADAPARILAVITPGILGAAYFREIGALVAAAMAAKAPPDPVAVAQIMLRHGLTPAPGR